MATATPVGTTARPPPARQHDVVARHQVGAGVTRPRVRGRRQIRVELVQGTRSIAGHYKSHDAHAAARTDMRAATRRASTTGH